MRQHCTAFDGKFNILLIIICTCTCTCTCSCTIACPTIGNHGLLCSRLQQHVQCQIRCSFLLALSLSEQVVIGTGLVKVVVDEVDSVAEVVFVWGKEIREITLRLAIEITCVSGQIKYHVLGIRTLEHRHCWGGRVTRTDSIITCVKVVPDDLIGFAGERFASGWGNGLQAIVSRGVVGETRWASVGGDLPVSGHFRAVMEFSTRHGIWEISCSIAFERGDCIEAGAGTGLCLASAVEAIRSSCWAGTVVQRLFRILTDLDQRK